MRILSSSQERLSRPRKTPGNMQVTRGMCVHQCSHPRPLLDAAACRGPVLPSGRCAPSQSQGSPLYVPFPEQLGAGGTGGPGLGGGGPAPGATCLLPLPRIPRALKASGWTRTSVGKLLLFLLYTWGFHVELDSRNWFLG